MSDWVLTLFPGAYEAIAQGGKLVEGRAPDPSKPKKDYSKLKPGDRIIFRAISEEDYQPLNRPDIIFPVTYNNHYSGNTAEDAIHSMLEAEGLEKLLPGFSSIKEGIKLYMGLPGYSERIAKHGIHAIGLGEKIH